MGETGSYILKTTAGEFFVEFLLVEDFFFLQKTEPGHMPIFLPYTFLSLCISAILYSGKIFHFSLYRKWFFEGGDLIGGTIKDETIKPIC